MDWSKCPRLTNNPAKDLIVIEHANLAQDRQNDFLTKTALFRESKVGMLPPGKQFLMPGLAHVQVAQHRDCIVLILQKRIDVQERILFIRSAGLDQFLIEGVKEQTNGFEEVRHSRPPKFSPDALK